VTISEFLKFLLSCSLFYRELISRETASSATIGLLENGTKESPSSTKYLSHRYDIAGFFNAYTRELPMKVSFGFAHLALFYVLINNTVSHYLMYILLTTPDIPPFPTCRSRNNPTNQVLKHSHDSRSLCSPPKNSHQPQTMDCPHPIGTSLSYIPAPSHQTRSAASSSPNTTPKKEQPTRSRPISSSSSRPSSQLPPQSTTKNSAKAPKAPSTP
jgi:hypothetical protein